MADKNYYPYDDIGDDDFVGATPAPVRDQKMKRILNELAELKTSIAASKATKTPAPAKAQKDAEILNELNRLREENVKAQAVQELSRMRDDMMQMRATHAATPQVYSELQRLSARLDAMERSVEYRNFDMRPQPRPYGAEELSLRLNKIENMLGEISVMTIANDVAPITKELAELKTLLADHEASQGACDKVLDELVMLQNSVEDLRRAIEDGNVDDPFGESPVIQDNLFDTKTLEKLTELDEFAKESFARIDERLSSIATDLHIFAGEEYARPVADEGSSTAPETATQPGLDWNELVKKSDVEQINAAMERMADALTMTLATVSAKESHTAAEDTAKLSQQLSSVAQTLNAVLDRLSVIEEKLSIATPIAVESQPAITVSEQVQAPEQDNEPSVEFSGAVKTDMADAIAEISGALDAFAAEVDQDDEAIEPTTENA